MPKKKETPTWESLDKQGMMLTGYCKADNLIMREICNTIGTSAYVVYLALLSHKNNNDTFSFPSQPVIAKETNLSDRQVRNLIDKLCGYNFISINSGNSQVSSKYYFPQEDFYNAGEDTWTRRTKPKEEVLKEKSIEEEIEDGTLNF